MKNVTLRMLVLAAATIAPQLTGLVDESAQVRHVGELSAEERRDLMIPAVRYVEESEQPGGELLAERS